MPLFIELIPPGESAKGGKMKIVLAFDSYKGCLSSKEIISIASKSIRKIIKPVEISGFIIADGGEGTLEALVEGRKGKIIRGEIHNLENKQVDAHIGVFDDVCIIECAQAVGIPYSNRKKVALKTSWGMGEQIRQALDSGYRKFAIGLGGSGTSDVGVGMLGSLGFKFLDQNKKPVKPLLSNLEKIKYIDEGKTDPRLKECEFVILSDVSNPLCGKNGATYTYGPQKGVGPDELARFDRAIKHFAGISNKHFNKDCTKFKGAGAAGGLGYAILEYLDGKAISGIDYILSALQFEKAVKQCDLVFTGEGKSDLQTAQGKVPVGVAKVAKKYNKPVLLVSGALEKEAYQLHKYGIDSINSIQDHPADIKEVMKKDVASSLLGHEIEQICRLLLIGKGLK